MLRSGIEIFSDDLERHRLFQPAFFDQRHNERDRPARKPGRRLSRRWIASVYAWLSIVPSVPMTPTRPVRVAASAARAPGSITPMIGTSKRARRAGQRKCARGVAGDDDHLHFFLQEKLGDLERKTRDDVARFGPVRDARGVPEINRGFVGQLLNDFAQNRQSSDAGIKQADRQTAFAHFRSFCLRSS